MRTFWSIIYSKWLALPPKWVFQLSYMLVSDFGGMTEYAQYRAWLNSRLAALWLSLGFAHHSTTSGKEEILISEFQEIGSHLEGPHRIVSQPASPSAKPSQATAHVISAFLEFPTYFPYLCSERKIGGENISSPWICVPSILSFS